MDGDNSKIELFPLNTIGIDEKNEKKVIESIEKRYTKKIRLVDEQARFNAVDDAMYVISSLLGLNDLIMDVKNKQPLLKNATSFGVVADISQVINRDYTYSYFNDDNEVINNPDTTNKVNFTEKDIETTTKEVIFYITFLLGGQIDHVSGIDVKNLLTGIINERCPGIDVGDFFSKYFSIWGPAIIKLAPKYRQNEFKNYEEYFEALVIEVMLNRICSRISEFLVSLGVTFIKLSVLHLVLIGSAIVILANPVAEGVRKALELKIKEESSEDIESEDYWSEILDTATEEFKKQFSLFKLLKGEKKSLFLLFDTHTDDPMIAELEIDTPGAKNGLKILGEGLKKSLFEMDLKSLFTHEAIGDISEFGNNIRGVSAYYGTVKAVGNVLKIEYQDRRELAECKDFIAFLDGDNVKSSDIMRSVIEQIFPKTGKNYDLSQYTNKQIELREIEFKEGDTLEGIAVRALSDVESLKIVNNINSEKDIKPDSILKIPPDDTVKYMVKKGDNLWEIAQEYNTDVMTLKRINNLKDDTICFHQYILVPFKLEWAYEDRQWTSFNKPEILEYIPRFSYFKNHYNRNNLLRINKKDIFYNDINYTLKEVLLEQCGFPESYIEKFLLKGIDVYYYNKERGEAHYFLQDISIIDQKIMRLSLGLNYTSIAGDYDIILNLPHNKVIIDENRVGKIFSNKKRKYDYLIINSLGLHPEISSDILKPNHNVLFGSLKQESHKKSKSEDIKEYSFYPGFGLKEEYKDSNGKGIIYINEQDIGKKLKAISFSKYTEVYEEILYKKNGEKSSNNKILLLKYRYEKASNRLIIEYGDFEKSFINYLTIEGFQNFDYGIELPRSHVIKGSLYTDMSINYRKGHMLEKGNYIEFTSLSDNLNEIYNYHREYKEDDEIPNKAEGILIDGKKIGYKIKFKRKINNSSFIYNENEKDVHYVFVIKENKLIIQYGKSDIDLKENIIPSFGNNIIVENFKNGDYNLHFYYEDEDYLKEFSKKPSMLLIGIDGNEEIKIDEGQDYYVFTEGEKCSTKKCILENICSKSECLSASYIFNEIGYKSEDKNGEIYVNNFKLSNLKKENISKIGTFYVQYSIEVGKSNFLLFRFVQGQDKNDQKNTLVIFYQRAERKNNTSVIWKKIIIKDFKHGDYNITVPMIVSSETYGSKKNE